VDEPGELARTLAMAANACPCGDLCGGSDHGVMDAAASMTVGSHADRSVADRPQIRQKTANYTG
jgi:hypothetical protein